MLAAADLRGGCAVITGAGDGIGRAMALAVAEAGMHVVVADIRADAAAAVAAEVTGKGVKARSVTLDVADAAAVENLAAQVFEEFGRVQLLCNNAGINVLKPVWELTPADWQFILSINLGGVINGVAAFVPRMVACGGPAHIVNTASIAGVGLGSLRTTHAPYVTSKYAIVGLTQTLAPALAEHGIGASVLCPGMVATGMMENGPTVRMMKGLPSVPPPAGFAKSVLANERVLQPGEVAAMVLQAVLENRLHIFPHPGRRFEIDGRNEQLLADIEWAENYFRQCEQ